MEKEVVGTHFFAWAAICLFFEIKIVKDPAITKIISVSDVTEQF